MRIPFVDLSAQYHAHRAEFDAALSNAIARTAFIGGEFVKQFEHSYSKSYGAKHTISCANGTDAIYIALRMLGVGPGDEVITTAISWISTSETITQAGARPVFVDVDDSGLIDVEKIEEKITSRTKALIPVHLYGQAVNMTRIRAICATHGLKLIEDCAQAHYAEWEGERVGTMGDVGTFSFYPGKNLGAWGDAGAIITSDEDLARRCRMYANHGALVKHQHEMEGINSRLDGLQAALLSAKLPFIGQWTRARQAVAREYDGLLRNVGDLRLPMIAPGASHVFHLYVVRTAEREALKIHLAAAGIETAIHYPTALPLLPAYRYLGHSAADFPRAARMQSEILSLPIYPEMTSDMISYVAESVKSFFGRPR